MLKDRFPDSAMLSHPPLQRARTVPELFPELKVNSTSDVTIGFNFPLENQQLTNE